MASSSPNWNEAPFVSRQHFQIVMWSFCGVATLFLASRLAVRMSTKGRLMANDYFLGLAFPALYTGAGLLHSSLGELYMFEDTLVNADVINAPQPSHATPRITAAIELLWISIFAVKFCFLAQFKFHKPLYAHVSAHLTRYYWTSIGVCAAACLFTMAQPIILCSSSGHCRYFQSSGTAAWEVAVTAIDIGTDLLVISIPILLIHMANFTRLHTILNASFKSLSLFNISIAATRLSLHYDDDLHRIRYVTLTFWLMIEASVALIAVSVSSYRVVILDYLAEQRLQQGGSVKGDMHFAWIRVKLGTTKEHSKALNSPTESPHLLSELPIVDHARRTNAAQFT